jgi:hypothetical protein
LVEYTGTGKATAVGLAAGPDGLYFTELYKDQNASSAIDPGARLFRIRYVPGNPEPGVTPQAPTFDLAAAIRHCRKKFRRHRPRARCIRRAKRMARALAG